ncbi:hypothetical protein [Nostoc sp.]|uniref:hypothetical protein n=1 Tax=Nostoc sp. TaxID=1180 RepID=UPI002FF72298
MARKLKGSDLVVGKRVHYWGENWSVWSIGDDEIVLVVPGYFPDGWYRPYPGELTKPTSVVVGIDNDFLWSFDEIKRNVFGKEIK